MTIIHTADWHLGQTFYGYERTREHEHFFCALRRVVSERRANALLVAGDVFDSPNPTAGAQRMLYRFLSEITAENPQLQVIITSGNHDSGARLEAPGVILESFNVFVRGLVGRAGIGLDELDYGSLIIPLKHNGRIVAWCLAVPFLRQGDCPTADSYGESVINFYKNLCAVVSDKTLPIVAMGHLQATGAEQTKCDDDAAERTLIGGIEATSLNAIASQVAYIALGHLHRAQQVSGNEHVRYAGAPLPMSFAEINNRQGVTLVELTDGDVRVERIDIEPLVNLQNINASSPQDALEKASALPDGEADETAPFLQICVQINQPEPSLRNDIEKALLGKAVRLVRIVSESPLSERRAAKFTYEDIKQIEPTSIAQEIFMRKYGCEMPDNLQLLMRQAIEDAERMKNEE